MCHDVVLPESAMKRSALVLTLGVAVIVAAFASSASARPATVSDDDVRSRIIQDSIASYSGSCPCPYNTMRNGRRCGGRSASSRPGGRAPLCYAEDVTTDMVARYRKAHGLSAPK